MASITQVKRKHPLAECENCPLYSHPCAPTQKPPQPKAALVSRSPGKYEAMAGRPFAGQSGKVVDFLLKQNGTSRREVMLSNVVLCTIDGTQVPADAIKACAPRLREELSDVPLIIAAGREAVNLLIGRGSIDRFRGYRIARDGKTFVATNNPALVLRDDSTFPNLKKDFKRAFNPNPPQPFPTYEVIEDARAARDFLRTLGQYEFVACDIESRGGLTHKANLISIQFAVVGSHATVIGERGGLFLNRDFIENDLLPTLQNRAIRFIFHNGKFDVKVLRSTYGISARVDHDTILLSYALDERTGGDDAVGVHGLEYLLMEEFGWPKYSNARIERAKKTGIVEDYDEFYEYAARDVGGTRALFDLYYQQAEKDNVLGVYNKVLLPATNNLLVPAELHGMVYDVQRAADLYEYQVRPELDDIRKDMRKQVDNPILNPNSPKQMSRILYEDWGIDHEMRKRSDKKDSVDDAARKEILAGRFTFRRKFTSSYTKTGALIAAKAADADDREEFYKSFVKKYDRWQELAKQASTYLIGLIENAETDAERRIYTDLLLFGTNSGRLSSRRPNLQNITRPREGIPNIRSLFRASRGCQIVVADFSQAELRCIAQFSHDKLLWGIYEEGRDLHSECAARFYGENFTKHNRDVAKNVNFGVFYRQTAATFQEKHDIPEKEAQPYIDWVWRTFTGVAEWEKNIETEIHAKGCLVSPFGRKRRFHLITEFNRQAAYREGINFYPQTTASDLTLTSAVRVAGEIDPQRAIIVLLVHDSIIGDVSDSYVDEYRVICKQVMESQARDELEWSLPFKADMQVGESWGSAK